MFTIDHFSKHHELTLQLEGYGDSESCPVFPLCFLTFVEVSSCFLHPKPTFPARGNRIETKLSRYTHISAYPLRSLATHRYSGGGPGSSGLLSTTFAPWAAKPPFLVAAQRQLGWERWISRRNDVTKLAKRFAGTGSRTRCPKT